MLHPCRRRFLLLLCLALPSCAQRSDGAGGEGNLSREIVAEALDTPWALDFLPDGTLLFVERPGRVNLLSRGERQVVGRIPVDARGEGGLLGVAVDPDFAANRHVYLYYTHATGNRISRFELRDSLVAESVLVDRIPSSSIHNGGRLRFGPDGKLYATTGDAAQPGLAQDTTSLAGKILRMERDGSVPEDNPFGNRVWSFGHRNPQGLDWHPESGELYASEHGPSSRDEINRIVKGGNYGWPEETCDETRRYRPSVRCYTEFTLAPAGIAFHQGALYVAGLRGRQLRRLDLSASGDSVASETPLLEDLGRQRAVHTHDGKLYVSTSNRDGRGDPRAADDRILRITTTGAGEGAASGLPLPTEPLPAVAR